MTPMVHAHSVCFFTSNARSSISDVRLLDSGLWSDLRICFYMKATQEATGHGKFHILVTRHLRKCCQQMLKTHVYSISAQSGCYVIVA